MLGIKRLSGGIGALCLAVALVACGGDSNSATTSGATGSGASIVSREVTVFAAASLTEAFTEIATEFEAQNPGTKVVFNFGGTPTLRTQLEQGARADVFASANVEQMDLARTSEVVDASASIFARNSLVVIVPSENRAGVNELSDLATPGLKLVVANEDVPVGAYTRQMLTAMDGSASFGAAFSERVLDNVVSLESNVKQVVAKVELGEADAGIVYGTDVTPSVASRLQKLEVPDEFNVIASYPIALVKDRQNEVAGQAFIEFILSEAGQSILARYGFLSGG